MSALEGEYSFLKCPGFRSSAVSHGFFGSQFGSCSLYASNGKQNREKVMEALGAREMPLLIAKQVHGMDCLVIAGVWERDDIPEADALVTDRYNLALGVLTADCAPVLFHGSKDDGSPVIGAAHAGWRGAVSGILENTIAGMVETGAEIETIQACIGPCIGPKSYEVRKDFKEDLRKIDPEGISFLLQREGSIFFDLPGYVTSRLRRAGVSKVFNRSPNTFSNENEYFSYRRSTQRKEENTGRQISVIFLS